MQPIAPFIPPKIKLKWNEEASASLNDVKGMLVHDALLVCPDFEKPFHLDSDASKSQLGGTTCQDHDMIACHSRRPTKIDKIIPHLKKKR